MPIQMWETADLLAVANPEQRTRPSDFWRSLFPGRHYSEKQKIIFDDIPAPDYRMAPFVLPNVQGRVMRLRGSGVKDFAPAYVKPKHVIDPTMSIPRMPGETILGSLSLEERFNRIVAQTAVLQSDYIDNRMEWLCCQAATMGEVTIAGEDYPSVTVNFQRNALLTNVLTGAATWDNATTADPAANFNLMRQRAFELGKSPIRRHVFGLDAWNAWSRLESSKKLLDNMNRGSNTSFNGTGYREGSFFEYQGTISGPNGGGQLEMWTYSNQYEDSDGQMKDFLDPRDVVGIGANMQGYQCFGAILDRKQGLTATDKFPKMWDEEDPSVTYTMTQSAPLAVPMNPNATYRMRVLP